MSQKLKNVTQLLEEVNNIMSQKKEHYKCDLIFRGQPTQAKEGKCNLLPKISRYKNKDVLNLEKLVIREFKRLAPPLITIDPIDDFDWLVLAQHFGLPTRLLDWTFNPLAAIWFALNSVKDDVRSSEIWIFAPDLKDYQKQQNYKGEPSEIKETMVYRPRNIISRIVNQTSIFTIHHIKEDQSAFALDNDPNFKTKLSRYEIDPTNTSSLLEELNRLNTNSSTVFPDLEGLCSHLKWLYFERQF